MDALDVISLEDAKSWLIVDDSDSDAAITRLIKTSVDWVEQYTSYRLYQRNESIVSTKCITGIPLYPISLISITKQDTTSYPVTTNSVTYGALKMYVHCPEQSTILLQTGYAIEDIDNIPQSLIDACYKLITYLFENRDAYGTTLPLDIQILINKYRRDALI